MPGVFSLHCRLRVMKHFFWIPYYFFYIKTSYLQNTWIDMETYLQCNDFNGGHPRLFNQSEADSLTKNFDFAVLKANQICS